MWYYRHKEHGFTVLAKPLTRRMRLEVEDGKWRTLQPGDYCVVHPEEVGEPAHLGFMRQEAFEQDFERADRFWVGESLAEHAVARNQRMIQLDAGQVHQTTQRSESTDDAERVD